MPELGEQLSDREIDVLQEMAQGGSNKEIASALDISPNTVKVHVRNLFAKLGASSRTEVVTLALQRGLLGGLLPDAAALVAADEDDPVDALPAEYLSVAAPPAAEPLAQSDTIAPRNRAQLVGGIAFLLLVIVALTVGILWRLRAAPAVAPFEATQFADTGWYTARPLDAPRSGLSLVSIGLNLYAIGGELADGSVTADLLRYDTQTQLWQPLAAKPTAVTGAAAAVVAGQIYVVGGRAGDGRALAAAEVYSPVNNAWRTVAPLPQPLSDSVALAFDNRLYLFGGDTGAAAVAAAYVYDPLSDGWRPLPAPATARSHAAGGVLNDRLLIVGGSSDGRALDSCEQFDPQDEQWSVCRPLLTPRTGAEAAALFNRLYLFGGENGGGSLAGEQYDPAGDVWQLVDVPPLATAQAWTDLGVAPVETRIYLVGGRRDGVAQAESYSFNPLPFQFFFPSTSSSP